MSDLPEIPTEDEIQALVDGRLDPGRRAEVEAWLSANPDEAMRVAEFRAISSAVERVYDPLLERQIPARLQNIGASAPVRSPIWHVAAMVALIAVGAAGGWFANDAVSTGEDPNVSLARGAVKAHQMYAREVRHAVEVPASEEAHLVAWLSKRLDAPLLAPNLDGEGYRLVGGRLLPASESGPAAQFMYEAESGERLTLYVEQNLAGGETAFRFTEYDDVSAFWWKDGPLAYVLIGQGARDRLLSLARATYQELNP
ncbi:MAG: anti-sigma factor [Alphaproteobacteria bacterium]